LEHGASREGKRRLNRRKRGYLVKLGRFFLVGVAVRTAGDTIKCLSHERAKGGKIRLSAMGTRLYSFHWGVSGSTTF